jgi:hypothetical protein
MVMMYSISLIILAYAVIQVIKLLTEMYLEYGLPLTAISLAFSLPIAVYGGKWFYGFLWRVVDRIKKEGRESV